MRGDHTPVVEGGNTERRPAVGEAKTIYRVNDNTHSTSVATDDDRIELDVGGVCTSPKNGSIPTALVPERDTITVHNRANANPIGTERGRQQRLSIDELQETSDLDESGSITGGDQSTLRDVGLTRSEEWQERINRIAHRLEILSARVRGE